MCRRYRQSFILKKEEFFMRKNYNSVYARYIKQFIEMKHALGYKFVTQQVILFQLDDFAVHQKEKSYAITREFADKWSKKRPNESELYRYTRISILAQFSKYLCDNKIKSFVPKLPPYPASTFIPYIYTPADMKNILKASTELRIRLAMMDSSIMCMPTIIRILYATGIRINEVLSLKDEDVVIEYQYLKVRDSKNGKERIIPISKSLAYVCKQYRRYRNKLPLPKQATYFFTRLNGKKCGYGSVTSWFKECLKRAAIQCTDKGLPRIHDLRHTFAVTSLANMAAAGIDLYASLPILSNYLGHQSIDSTNHYVRLTANMYPELIKELNITCLNVFPKFKNYEAD
jgi:integrase/recombinase XerD